MLVADRVDSSGRADREDLAAADSFHRRAQICESCGLLPVYIPLTRSSERFARLSAAESAARQ